MSSQRPGRLDSLQAFSLCASLSWFISWAEDGRISYKMARPELSPACMSQLVKLGFLLLLESTLLKKGKLERSDLVLLVDGLGKIITLMLLG